VACSASTFASSHGMPCAVAPRRRAWSIQVLGLVVVAIAIR
jgi:hypothetical protein